MRLRVALCLMLLTGGSAVWHAGEAGAVTIDPALKSLLADKAQTRVPVLLVFDDPVTFADLVEEKKLDPAKRRRLVLAKLKAAARKRQARAMAVIAGHKSAAGASEVVQLYLAGAISFTADAALVSELAGLEDQATLVHDRTFDLISGTGPHEAAALPLAPADTSWNLLYVGVDKVWSEMGLTGAGVLVGHVDSGVWLDHPDLRDRLWHNPGEIPGNGLDDDGNGFIDDLNGWDFGDDDNDPNDDAKYAGHGTHTAGTVVGDGTGGTQTGAAPGARLMVAKAFTADGDGTLGMMWRALQYCVENDARILTMSLGVPGNLPVALIRAERLNAANIRDAGVIFLNAAGNDHNLWDPPFEINLTARVPSPWQPTGVPHSSSGGVISVGGTGYRSETLYSESSHGPARWDHIEPWHDWPYAPGDGLVKPDVGAPGSGINSTVIPAGYSGDTWSGTSMACPLVAGVAALMLEKNPSLSPVGVDSLLQLSAVDLGDPGKDNQYGAGRLDAWAALQAVPDALRPNLVRTGLRPDFDGDGSLDPGELSRLAVDLVNVGTQVTAHGVSATLRVAENPWVTVTDAHGAFADLAPGAAGHNEADPFTLQVAAGAPQGYPLALELTVSTAEGFQAHFDFAWYVGRPLWRTHRTERLFATVTAQGALGYLGQGSEEGEGLGLTGQGSSLFVGSLWAGTGPNYVCNRDYTGLNAGVETHEWVTAVSPSGRLRDLGPVKAAQTFSASFTDAGHAVPMPLSVSQTSRVNDCRDCEEIVILEYRLTNGGAVDQPDFHAGLYCDFDLGDSMANGAGTDPARNLAWISREVGTGPYFGVVLLDDNETAANTTLVNNIDYVWATSSISDENKFDLLSGARRHEGPGEGDDWSVLVSRHAPLAAGESRTLAWAVVHGATLAELGHNAETAVSLYAPIAGGEPNIPAPAARLDQNRPNPFNPLTRIDFVLEAPGPVDLAVYDLSGRRVRTLVQGHRGEGAYSAQWDGLDDSGAPQPSGTYVYRLHANGGRSSRKMILLK